MKKAYCVFCRAFGKLNHIVNNAGFTFDGMIHKINDKQWDLMLAVHQTAPFKIIRAAAKYLVSKGGKLYSQISSRRLIPFR